MNWKPTIKKLLAGSGWKLLRMGGRRPEEPRIAVIMYHSVGNGAIMSIDKHVFEEQLSRVREMFADILTVRELAGHSAPVQSWSACITFDDGFSDNHEIVLPLLKKYDLVATFFICSGFVEGEHDISRRFRNYHNMRPMNWGQVRELVSEGMEIGAHTHSHPVLSRLSPMGQEEEMLRSRRLIEERVGVSVDSFAIPFGNRGTYTRETLELASRHFHACCTTRFATNPALPARHNGMLVLDRVEPKPTDELKTFEAKILGRWDAMRWLQRIYHGL